jgi:predicted amidohydrolase
MSTEPDDLAIRGGVRVLDPSQHLDGPTDIGIRDGPLVTIGRVPDGGEATPDGAGPLAAPGWIDLHAHAADRLGRTRVDPDHDARVARGVTTVVDAGSCAAELCDAPTEAWSARAP